MKSIVFVILTILCVISWGDVAEAQSDSTRLERYEYVLGGSLIYSLFDYVGFGLTQNHPAARTVYRGIQAATQIAISYVLYKELGLSSAISFNLMWWTWVDDLGFYGWANVLNPPWPPWENRSHTGLMGRQINWAGWTPIGLLRPQGSLIARDALIMQAIVVFSISMAIVW